MNYWITTDTHFGHRNMIQYCDRPMNFEQKILDNLRKVVTAADVLIHLGDICFGNDEYWHKELQSIGGKRWLVRGNHDTKGDAWYVEHGWDCVCKVLVLDILGGEIFFSHRPLPDTGFFLNIHGHFHNTDYRKHEPQFAGLLTPKHILLAMEHNNYMPYKLKTLVSKKRTV